MKRTGISKRDFPCVTYKWLDTIRGRINVLHTGIINVQIIKVILN